MNYAASSFFLQIMMILVLQDFGFHIIQILFVFTHSVRMASVLLYCMHSFIFLLVPSFQKLFVSTFLCHDHQKKLFVMVVFMLFFLIGVLCLIHICRAALVEGLALVVVLVVLEHQQVQILLECNGF